MGEEGRWRGMPRERFNSSFRAGGADAVGEVERVASVTVLVPFAEGAGVVGSNFRPLLSSPALTTALTKSTAVKGLLAGPTSRSKLPLRMRILWRALDDLMA